MYKEKEKDKDKEKEESSKSILLTAKNSFVQRPQSKLNLIIEKAKNLRRKSNDSPIGRSLFSVKKPKINDLNISLKRLHRHRSSIHFSFLEKKSPKELFYLLRNTERNLFLLDLNIFIIDLLLIVLMYINIIFQRNKDHSLTLVSNILRIAFIFISLGVIAIIIFRRNIHANYKMIEYLLRIKTKYPRGQKKNKILIFEICIHCINLIPFYSPMITFKYNGIKNSFCLDIPICLIATLRLYSISRLYCSILQYYQGSINRLIKRFQIYNMLLFYIKKSIISNPLITLFILFWIICVFTFFVFGIMECHISSDSNQLCKEFSLSNSFWFISNVIFQRK
jgi:hypothetical protein